MISELAAKYNRDAAFYPGSGTSPDDEAPLPSIEVAGALVNVYVEDDGDEGLRLVVSLHLDAECGIPDAMLRDDLVPVRVNVNGEEVFFA